MSLLQRLGTGLASSLAPLLAAREPGVAAQSNPASVATSPGRMPTLSPAFKYFYDHIRYHVEGWVSEGTPEIIDLIDQAQRGLGVSGDIVEIGVHHGLFLMLLAAARRDAEAVRAFDIFDQQELNLDLSGSGSEIHVTNAVKMFYGPTESHFVVTRLDSLAIRPHNLLTHLPAPVRLFSVDGGHTQIHVVNDLSIAQDVLTPGGVAILDDFVGPHWMSVTEGFFRYMSTVNNRLAPFLFFENKLYLTTYSEHPLVLAKFKQLLRVALGAHYCEAEWKELELCGSSVLSKG